MDDEQSLFSESGSEYSRYYIRDRGSDVMGSENFPLSNRRARRKTIITLAILGCALLSVVLFFISYLTTIQETRQKIEYIKDLFYPRPPTLYEQVCGWFRNALHYGMGLLGYY